MTATGYERDAQAMATAIDGFELSAGTARSTMSALENELRSALSRYQGSQAQAFWQLHARLHDDMELASRELDTMSELVGKSTVNYNRGDEDVADSLNTLVGQTGNSAILGRLSGA
jgi:uncharacterized protein YukE